jgi:hypothetical protein
MVGGCSCASALTPVGLTGASARKKKGSEIQLTSENAKSRKPDQAAIQKRQVGTGRSMAGAAQVNWKST